MSVKSEIVEEESGEEDLTFPVLMKDQKETVVLFISESEGTVVRSGLSEVYGEGHTTRDWLSVHNKSCWSKFTGKIVLQNDD